jgi:hypothetical protein
MGGHDTSLILLRQAQVFNNMVVKNMSLPQQIEGCILCLLLILSLFSLFTMFNNIPVFEEDIL